MTPVDETTMQNTATADPEAMTLPEVQRELASYRPGAREAVLTTEAWLARRMQLWRRLDELLARAGAATPQQRGAEAS